MKKETKIVIVGAGSRCFGLGQIADILQSKELRKKNIRLCLVDINEEALDIMTKTAERINSFIGSNAVIESTTDRRKALPGADYVIVALARRRYELWEQDYRIPTAYGFKQALGENGGPGALFHTLRSFELVIPVCKDVEKYCPKALLLNFTNPEARVLHAITHLTKIKAAGICHGVFSAIEQIEKYLGIPREKLEIISAGMNHFYAILEIREKKTGRNLLNKAIGCAIRDRKTPHPLFRKFAEVFGIFTFPSDDHIGEYLPYGTDFWGTKWHYGIECRRIRGDKDESHDLLREYSEGMTRIDHPDILRRSGEITVDIITDIEFDRKMFRPAVNVLNIAGYIENLPRDIVVEVPGMVDAKGLHPMKVGKVPETFATLMSPHFMIHRLLTEAYRTGSKNLLLQALLLDPNVNSVTNAEKMLDEMLDMQKDFLPKFR